MRTSVCPDDLSRSDPAALLDAVLPIVDIPVVAIMPS
jgi:hypothetical protein